MRIPVTLLRRLWPHGDANIPGLVDGIAAASEDVFAKYGITTPLQAAHILAQISHECGAGAEVVENLSYSAARMTQVWPSRFPSVASALPYAHNPKALADKVYNGRMGNHAGSDDGYNFRGRGASQTTGRDGYARLAAKTGLDLLNNPDLVNTPRYFLECGVADFILCGCLPYCDPRPGLPDGDIRGVTHHLNGGYVGLDQRQAWFARWRAALPDVETDNNDTPADDGILRYGATGYEVKALQLRMVDLGYQLGAQDGDFGAGTRAAVLAFQADNAIATTGAIDAETKAALNTAPPKPISEARASATAADLRAGGSETIAKADNLTWWGRIIAATGMAGGGAQGAQKAGLIDTVNAASDQVSQFHAAFDHAHDAVTWMISTATAYWWLVLIAVGFFGVKYGGDIIARRLADHREAFNLKQ